MKIVRFNASHLSSLRLQDAQAYMSSEILKPEHGALIAQAGQSFTVLDGKTIIACGGCAEIWSGRAVVWALISRDAGPFMVGIHKAVAGFLVASKYRRIEAWVDEGFGPGLRWLRLLGFTLETPFPMHGFRPDGGACFLFSKVK